MKTVNLVIVNPAVPTQTHTSAFVGLVNALSAAKSLAMYLSMCGLKNREMPIIFVESEYGKLSYSPNGQLHLRHKEDDVYVVGQFVNIQEDNMAVVGSYLEMTFLPEWVFTWSASVGL